MVVALVVLIQCMLFVLEVAAYGTMIVVRQAHENKRRKAAGEILVY